MEKSYNKENFFGEFREVLVQYINERLELAKLDAYEKSSRVAAIIFSLVILAGLFFITVLFISLMGGYYLSDLLNSYYLGFGAVAGFYLLLFLLLLVFRKPLLENGIMNRVLGVLLNGKNKGHE